MPTQTQADTGRFEKPSSVVSKTSLIACVSQIRFGLPKWLDLIGVHWLIILTGHRNWKIARVLVIFVTSAQPTPPGQRKISQNWTRTNPIVSQPFRLSFVVLDLSSMIIVNQIKQPSVRMS